MTSPKRNEAAQKLPPGYEIRRAGDFLHVHSPTGRYLGNALHTRFRGLKRARRIAWDDYEGRGTGTVLERG